MFEVCEPNLVHVLHDWRVHDVVEEALVLLPLLVGDYLGLPRAGEVVVEDGNEGFEGGSLQRLFVHKDEQWVGSHVTTIPLTFQQYKMSLLRSKICDIHL